MAYSIEPTDMTTTRGGAPLAQQHTKPVILILVVIILMMVIFAIVIVLAMVSVCILGIIKRTCLNLDISSRKSSTSSCAAQVSEAVLQVCTRSILGGCLEIMSLLCKRVWGL